MTYLIMQRLFKTLLIDLILIKTHIFKYNSYILVKCRKITHGYCTLEIVSGLHKMGNCTTKRDKMHTIQHRHSSPRIQIQIHNMSLCSWRHFYACTDRRAICATVHHSFISAAQFYIYVALIAYRSFDAQQQEVYWKCQKAAISTDPRRLLIDLF